MAKRIEKASALWIETDRARADKINAAVRDLQAAEDDLTRLPTWGHLTRSADRIREAADRLIAAVAEARVIPTTEGD